MKAIACWSLALMIAEQVSLTNSALKQTAIDVMSWPLAVRCTF